MTSALVLFAALTSGVQADGVPTRWSVSEQPRLKSQLEHAPPASVEDVAPGPRSVEAYGTLALVPNPDGGGYDALYLYYKTYTEDVWLYAFDLGTRTLHKSRFPDGFQIHLSGQALAPDGRFYITTNTPGGGDQTGGMNLFVYDPATNALENRGVIVKGLKGERRGLLYGPDGYLYGTGSYPDAKKAGAYRYDFRTGEVRDYGPVGPSHAPHGAWGYFLGVDDQYLYVASGKVPWYLVAVNLKTGEDKVILERPGGDRSMWIIERYPGAVLKAKSDGLLPANQFDQEYWLWHGKAIPKTDDNPPWPATEPPLPGSGPEPEIYDRAMRPDANGTATFWYRLAADKPPAGAATGGRTPEQLGWRKIVVEDVPTYPLDVHRMALLPDGQLFVAAEGYNGRGLFDPATGETKEVGDGGGSTYTYVVTDDRLWFSGYSSGPVYVYDWRKPWTLGAAAAPGTPAVEENSRASNPRRVATLMDSTRMKKVLSSTLAGDGLVFFGGLGQRDYAGGGLGWVDPKTLESGGVWKPFSGYRTYWLTAVNGGSHLIASTKTSEDELDGGREPETARVFLVDARTKQVVRYFEPVPGAEMAGPVLEVAPGRLLGITRDPAVAGGGILYGIDYHTGEVLFRKKLPSVLEFKWMEGTAEWDFQLGPDGNVYTYLGRVLVRIDPADANVECVGRLERPGRMQFVGNDLYLTGTPHVRRIRAVTGSP